MFEHFNLSVSIHYSMILRSAQYGKKIIHKYKCTKLMKRFFIAEQNSIQKYIQPSENNNHSKVSSLKHNASDPMLF